MRALLVMVVIAGCSHSEDSRPAPVVAGAPVPRVAADALAVDAVADDLPPLRLDPAATVDAKRAVELNTAGLVLHRKHDYAAAIVKFRAALASDPSHLLARYNLACAYNRSGETARGMALLNELAKPGCGRCRGILAHATEDEDWHDQWKLPAFVALTSDAVRALTELRAAAKAISKTWLRCEAKGLVPFIDPTTIITLDENNCCYDNPKDGIHTTKLSGPKMAASIISERDCRQGVRMTVSDRIVCDGRCCSYEGDVHDGEVATLLGVCFRDDRMVLSDVAIGHGP
jgi:hypothetical protein